MLTACQGSSASWAGCELGRRWSLGLRPCRAGQAMDSRSPPQEATLGSLSPLWAPASPPPLLVSTALK